jgi:hypothetical protein
MSVTPRIGRFPNDQDIEHHAIAELGGGGSRQLLKRMEGLQLEAVEVRRIEPGVFSDLAQACANCESKQRCEQGLADAAPDAVARGWEIFCPNAATLSALATLPWFGKAESGGGSSS